MLLNIALLLFLSLAWASNYVFIAWVDDALPALTATASITLTAAFFLMIGVRFGMRRPLWPIMRDRPAVPLLMAATAVALPQLSVVAAEDSISPSLATVIGTTVPILTFLVAVFLLRTVPLRWMNLLGVAIAVAGIIVFADPSQLLHESAELSGIAIMVSGGVVFVINGIYAANRSADLDPYALSAWVMTFAAIGLTIIALLVDGGPSLAPQGREVAGIALAGFVGTGLAYLLYYALIGRAGASFTALYAFLVPPFGVLFTVLFDDGTLSLRHVVGLVIVLCGLWFVMRPGTAAT